MKLYSKDLRLKVLEALDRGMPRREVAKIFGISMPTIKRAGSSGAEKQGSSRQDRALVLLPGRAWLLSKPCLPSFGYTPTLPSKSIASSSRRLTAFRSLRPASAVLLSDSVYH